MGSHPSAITAQRAEIKNFIARSSYFSGKIPPVRARPNAPQYAIDDLPIVKRRTALASSLRRQSKSHGSSTL
jgi:hypothetical protein